MLEYPGEWKFADVDEIPAVSSDVVDYFYRILVRIADGDKSLIEVFKGRFGATTTSSSFDWALSDLDTAMRNRSMNEVAFIDALWSALEDAKGARRATPSAEQVNRGLRQNGAAFEVQPPALVRATDAIVVSSNTGSSSSIDRYLVGESLGQGGFGEVFLATRETSVATFEFALKKLNPSPFVNQDKALARFEREVRALRGLQHRGIVLYVDAGVDPARRPFLVMSRISGNNVRDWSEGRSPNECVTLMVEVLAALAYAHSRNVLHRDLKPSNILVRESDNQPVILDFGHSYLLDDLDTDSLTMSAVGSLGYIPPEVLADPKERTPKHDVFSAAVILYEMIARNRPDTLSYRPLEANFRAPAGLDDVIRRALGPVSQRHATATEFRDALIATLG